jgi:hypothetical protein
LLRKSVGTMGLSLPSSTMASHVGECETIHVVTLINSGILAMYELSDCWPYEVMISMSEEWPKRFSTLGLP